MPKYAILAGTLSSSPSHVADFPEDLTRIYRASAPHMTSGEAFDVGDAGMSYMDGLATPGARWVDVYYGAIGKNDGSHFFGSDPRVAIPFLVADVLSPIIPTYSKKLQLEVVSKFDNLRSLGFLADYVEKNIKTDPAFLEKFNKELEKACDNHTKYNRISLAVTPETSELYLLIDEKAPQTSPPKSFYDKVKSAWGGFKKNILAPLWVVIIIDIMVFWFEFIFRSLLMGSYQSGIQIAGSIAGSIAMTTVLPALFALSYFALKMRNWVEHNRLITDDNKNSTWWKKIDKALFNVQWYGFQVQWKKWPGPTKLIPAIGKFLEAALNMVKILTFDLVRYIAGFFVMAVVTPSVAWKNRQIRDAQALNPVSPAPERTLAYDDPKTQELGCLIQKAKCALDFSKETEDSKHKTGLPTEPSSPRVRRVGSLDIKAIKNSEDSEFDWGKLEALQKKYQDALNLIGEGQNGDDWKKQLQKFLATHAVSSTLSFVTAASSGWLIFLYLTWQYDDALIIAGNPLSQDAHYAIGLMIVIMAALMALDTALDNKTQLESAKQNAARILQEINAKWQELDVEQIQANKNIPVFSHLAYLDEMSKERSFETWMKRGLLAFGSISGVTMFRVATVPGTMNFLPYAQAYKLPDYRLFVALAVASGVLWCTVKVIESFYQDNKKAAQRYIEHGEQYIHYLSNLAKVYPKLQAAETPPSDIKENKARITQPIEQSVVKSLSQGELLGRQLSLDLRDPQDPQERDSPSPLPDPVTAVYQS